MTIIDKSPNLTSKNNTQPLHAQALAGKRHAAFTGMATICPISGVMLAVTNQFEGTRFAGNLAQQVHPVFGLKLKELALLATDLLKLQCSERVTVADAEDAEALATTEQFLMLTAFLYQLGVLEVRCPIRASAKAVCKAWQLYWNMVEDGVVDYLIARAGSTRAMTLPVLRVTPENNDFSAIVEHFKLVLQEVNSVTMLLAEVQRTKPVATPADTTNASLEEELTLKTQLKMILTGQEELHFSPKLVKIVMRELVSSEYATERDIFIVRKALTTSELELSEAELVEARESAKSSFDLHHSPYRSHILLAIAQIERKLQSKLEIEQNLGFIILEEEKGAASDTITYNTKTKATSVFEHVKPLDRKTTTGQKASFAELMAQAKARRASGG